MWHWGVIFHTTCFFWERFHRNEDITIWSCLDSCIRKLGGHAGPMCSFFLRGTRLWLYQAPLGHRRTLNENDNDWWWHEEETDNGLIFHYHVLRMQQPTSLRQYDFHLRTCPRANHGQPTNQTASLKISGTVLCYRPWRYSLPKSVRCLLLIRQAYPISLSSEGAAASWTPSRAWRC